MDPFSKEPDYTKMISGLARKKKKKPLANSRPTKSGATRAPGGTIHDFTNY